MKSMGWPKSVLHAGQGRQTAVSGLVESGPGTWPAMFGRMWQWVPASRGVGVHDRGVTFTQVGGEIVGQRVVARYRSRNFWAADRVSVCSMSRCGD